MGNGVASQVWAAAFVVAFAVVGLWDGYVKLFHPQWPTVSSVVQTWFEREPVLRFLAWLLVYHLFVVH
jgi:hypothetical protein